MESDRNEYVAFVSSCISDSGMAPIVPHFLCLSLAVTLACFLVVGSEDLPVYELQARCAAQCLVYDPQGKVRFFPARLVAWANLGLGYSCSWKLP